MKNNNKNYSNCIKKIYNKLGGHMNNKKILVFRTLLLFLIIIGIIMNFIAKDYNINMLLSYYTIQSNIIVAIIVSLEIINESKKISFFANEETLQNIKGATTIIIFITGLIFTVLLTPYVKDWKGLRLYSSYILHYLSPIMCIIDYLFFDKLNKKQNFKKIILWFIYPTIYYILGIIRIIYIDGFIPYPFMNIEKLGIGKSILTFFILLIIFYCFAIILCTLKNKINKKNYKYYQ